MSYPYPADDEIPEGARVLKPVVFDSVDRGLDVDFRPVKIRVDEVDPKDLAVLESALETHPSVDRSPSAPVTVPVDPTSLPLSPTMDDDETFPITE